MFPRPCPADVPSLRVVLGVSFAASADLQSLGINSSQSEPLQPPALGQLIRGPDSVAAAWACNQTRWLWWLPEPAKLTQRPETA